MPSRFRTKPRKVAVLETVRDSSYGASSSASMANAISQIPARYFTIPQSKHVVVTDTMQDRVIPNFKEMVSAGEILPTNPMSRTEPGADATAFLGVTLTRETESKGHTSYYAARQSYSASATARPKRLLLDKAINDAKIRAIAKTRSQGMDMSTSLSELHKTLAMIAGFKKTLTDAFASCARAARHKNKKPFKSLSEFWDVFSSLWLEGRFGWRILVYDLMALEEYLSEKRSTDLIVGRDLVSAEKKEVSYIRKGTFARVTISHDYSDKVQVGYPGLIDLTIPGFASITNTAWDVIPFSLVVDWFFDVQSTIFAFNGKSINVKELPASSFLTRSLSCVTTVTIELDKPGDYSPTDVVHIAGVSTASVKTREVPGDYRLGIAFNPDLSNYRWLDLMTLVKPMYKLLFR